ncbi:MAG: SPOR domain-containing protein [Desulfatitalea sp.]|nr:SPOR domain-containing protein [Desulfatitalea sp.]
MFVTATFRHLALRLWATALLGGLACVLLLPVWHRIAGLDYIALPVALVMIACFMLLGWGMNRIGVRLLRRQVGEARLWARAGMTAEAEAAFERAKAIFDSYWLSPLRQRRIAGWITSRLARFHLARSPFDSAGRAMVETYLLLRSQDDQVALGWLEKGCHQEHRSHREHNLADRINAALPDNEPVQRRLMQYYLADMRADFEAVGTYERVWRRQSPLPDTMVRNLGRVLLNAAHLNDWALEVYLKAYELGEQDCLAGVAEGHRYLLPWADNRNHLELAEQILAKHGNTLSGQLIQPFAAPDAERSEQAPAQGAMPLASIAAGLCQAAGRIKDQAARLAQIVNALPFKSTLAKKVRPPKTETWPLSRPVLCGIALAAAVMLAVVAWRATHRLPEAPPSIDPLQSIAPPPVTDPFTIQVAAYLKPADAQRYVDQLKHSALDAYWTKVVSADRTWYQVKVSHFPTKEAARAYGRTLKSKGLIDDFYVSNYGR